MHYMETDKTHREKARREMCKNMTKYTEQILEATFHEPKLYGHLTLIPKTIE